MCRPLEGAWPDVWLDAAHLEVREGARIIGLLPDDDATIRRVGVFAPVIGPMAPQWLTARDQRRTGGRPAIHEP